MRAHVRKRVLEDADRPLVVRLGVVDDDEAHVEAVGLAACEVEVSIIPRVIGVLVVRGRDEPAFHVARTVETCALTVEKRERSRRVHVRRHRGRGQCHRLAGARSACRALVHHGVDVVRESERDASLVGGAVFGDRPIPLGGVGRRAADGVARVAREERRTRADVLGRAGPGLIRRDAEGGGSGRDAARARARRT